MRDPVFRFKQFDVDQTGCAMKVNTDGVLLGAMASADRPRTILDVGTGSGVIALMLAQRYPDAAVKAVEVEEEAARRATLNFAGSTFADRLQLFMGTFQDYSAVHPGQRIDLLVSNPPFFIDALQNPNPEKALARHADRSFFEDLAGMADRQLSEGGKLWLILPVATAEMFLEIARGVLFLERKIGIKSFQDSYPHRYVLSLGRRDVEVKEGELVIYEAPRVYTPEYRSLLQDFLIVF